MRMAMALGAFKLKPQERMRDLKRTRHAIGALALPVQIEGAPLAVEGVLSPVGGGEFVQVFDIPRPLLNALPIAAGGQQDALDELVVRKVLMQAGPHPRRKARRVILVFQPI